MPKYLKILFLQLMIFSQASFGQAIVRYSLSCLGSTVSDDGFILRQTIGQSSNTYMFNKEGLVLRQGFQQPIASYNYIKAMLPIDFTLSPNPADDMVMIKFQEEISKCTISIRDINGILITELKVESLQAKLLDLKNLIPGIYIITVISDNSIGSKKLIITQ
ncbi:MAG: T9SS type A sorting domain-containing protein [Bacteroidales bacterium]